MADAKTTALTALLGTDVADGDVLPIVDVSAGATKKITAAEARIALVTAARIAAALGYTPATAAQGATADAALPEADLPAALAALGGVLSHTKICSAANLLALDDTNPASFIEIVPAPGANKILIPVQFLVYTNNGVALSDGSQQLIFTHKDRTGASLSAGIDAPGYSNTLEIQAVNALVAFPDWTVVVNQPIVTSLGGAEFTDPGGANIVTTFVTLYRVLDVS